MSTTVREGKRFSSTEKSTNIAEAPATLVSVVGLAAMQDFTK